MASKSTTPQKGARKSRAPQVSERLRRRAERIINDPHGYDVDTREAVKASLDRGDAEELREDVHAAERGVMLADMTLREDVDEPPLTLKEAGHAARSVVFYLTESSNMADGLRDLILLARFFVDNPGDAENLYGDVVQEAAPLLGEFDRFVDTVEVRQVQAWRRALARKGGAK